MVLIVTYDLHNPGRDYKKVEAAIHKLGSWAHPQGSVWMVDTSTDTLTVVKTLYVAGDANDEYLVSRLHHNQAFINMDKDVEAWLRSPSRTW